MRCDDARASYLSGEATTEEQRHLESCAQCQSERTALELVRATLDDDMFWATPPAGLADRLVNLIVARPADAARPHRRWLRALGAAAAVVAVVGLWGLSRGDPADWEVSISGTAEAPQAVGVVRGWNEPGGTRIALEVAGLPDAPAGAIYEMWFTRGSTHISSGTFVAADAVELWVGVARKDYPRVWITLEPLDQDASPSGVTVMDTG